MYNIQDVSKDVTATNPNGFSYSHTTTTTNNKKILKYSLSALSLQ